jgi:secreted trypsin-like serine protease
MNMPRSNSLLFIFTMILISAVVFTIFGPVAGAQAQDIDPPTPPAEQETATPMPEVQETVTPTSDEIEAQIVGGAVADPGEWPWQVEVNLWVSGGYYICGGSLIAPRWVLTAAHCVTLDNGHVAAAGNIYVYAGQYNRNNYYEAQERYGIQVIRHSSYNDDTLVNDIALIKLNSPVDIVDGGGNPPYKTAVIPLVPSNVGSLTGVYAWTTGWGDTRYGGDTSAVLREVKLPIISNTVCNNSDHWGGGITSSMLCAGYDSGTKSTCQGDSGGPLAVQIGGEWKLAGVTSFGPVGCNVPYAQSVFTRVSQYVSWINSRIFPRVSSIVRTDANPTFEDNVSFTVTFSESVTGVDESDFNLVTDGVTGAAISLPVIGFGTTYTVNVTTGSGSGVIRLDLVDDDSITNEDSVPLAGTNSGNFSGQTYAVRPSTLTFSSFSTRDGWVLESGESTNIGGTPNSTATTFRLGDDAAKKQYRSILSFTTGSSLPDNAVITGITLKIRKQGIIGGGNPVTTFQGFMVDIKKGYFGTSALQTADFQTAASKTYGPFKPALSSSWYNIDLTGGQSYINKLSSSAGLTQIRLRFKLDDNNNTVANYLSLYSGNAGSAYSPQLVIEYYVP